MTDKDQHHADVETTAANDNRPNAVQSGDAEPVTLSSSPNLFPLVRLLARQAAAEWFREAANDNRKIEEERR